MNSDWGATPIDLETFIMIGGGLVVKKSPKVVSFFRVHMLASFPLSLCDELVNILVMSMLILVGVCLCSRFLGLMRLLTQVLTVC